MVRPGRSMGCALALFFLVTCFPEAEILHAGIRELGSCPCGGHRKHSEANRQGRVSLRDGPPREIGRRTARGPHAQGSSQSMSIILGEFAHNPSSTRLARQWRIGIASSNRPSANCSYDPEPTCDRAWPSAAQTLTAGAELQSCVRLKDHRTTANDAKRLSQISGGHVLPAHSKQPTQTDG
jgi:hypothetical protein